MLSYFLKLHNNFKHLFKLNYILNHNSGFADLYCSLKVISLHIGLLNFSSQCQFQTFILHDVLNLLGAFCPPFLCFHFTSCTTLFHLMILDETANDLKSGFLIAH